MRTLQEETVECSKEFWAGSATKRIIDGKTCYLMFSTKNKEEAIAEYKYWQDFLKRDEFSRKREFAKITTMRYGFGKGIVYLIWNCWK